MATVDGTDAGDTGYGVLGRGIPWEYGDQDGNTISVNSVGVWGVLGTASDIANIEDEVASAWTQTANAGIAGRNTLASGGHAVYGERRPYLAPATTFGSLAASDRSGQPTGVYGESDHQGVVGLGTGPGIGVVGVGAGTGTGVKGVGHGSAAGVDGQGHTGGSFDGSFEGVHAVSHHSKAAGVAGYNDSTGIGVFGKSTGGPAGFFSGNVVVDGNAVITGHIEFSGGDCAEHFEVDDAGGLRDAARPGTVMVINSASVLSPSAVAYDKRVAGVVSGAGGLRPGVVLDKHDTDDARRPIALIGKVYCQVDADYGGIEVGDLLTTSPTPGHAMKAADVSRAFGSVLGKALEPLAAGRGLVAILVALT